MEGLRSFRQAQRLHRGGKAHTWLISAIKSRCHSVILASMHFLRTTAGKESDYESTAMAPKARPLAH